MLDAGPDRQRPLVLGGAPAAVNFGAADMLGERSRLKFALEGRSVITGTI